MINFVGHDVDRGASAQRDPFELYADWRAEEELGAPRARRWAMGAALILLGLSSLGFAQVLLG